jgi:TRAP-type mannitol/chloroaromatic compound transport system permease small subunit
MSAKTDAGGSSPSRDLAPLLPQAELPHTALSARLDTAIRWIGDRISWVWVALVAVITVNVVMRYVFGQGRIEFEELQWHLYSIGFLVGIAYCFEADDHVRIDVFHEHFDPRIQGWIDLVGIVVFLLPFVALVLIFSVPFVAYSFSIHEVSEAPGGLPLRWAIKAVLLLGGLLLLVAALSRLTRLTALLFGVPKPRPASRKE